MTSGSLGTIHKILTISDPMKSSRILAMRLFDEMGELEIVPITKIQKGKLGECFNI